MKGYTSKIWRMHFAWSILGIISMFIWANNFPINGLFRVALLSLSFYLALFYLGSIFGVGPLRHIRSENDKEYEDEIKPSKQPWETDGN